MTAWLTAVIAAAELWRARNQRRAQDRATRAEIARRKGSDERVRIAQELHDLLGHHVSLINIQAGVALHLMDGDPEQARTALTHRDQRIQPRSAPRDAHYPRRPAWRR